ncbi:alanine racemase [Carnobacteriaceae bacterium zg-ZUI252]|nr:alanine racemase [Carnobacteriaceae bacterium zg-ZUI252]
MKNPQLTINLAALTYNTKMAMNKTNGHFFANVSHNALNLGLKQVVRTLYHCGVRDFTTYSLNEARQIREMYDDVTILYTGITTDFDTLRNYRIDAYITSYDFIKAYYKYMHDISWHIQYAGAALVGCQNNKELLEVLKKALESELTIVGLATQLPSPTDKEMYATAKNEWLQIIELLSQFHSFQFVHAQTCDTLIYENGLIEGNTHARLTQFIYGLFNKENVASVITLKATVSHITTVPAGQKINDFIANSPTRVAIVNIGYANGLIPSRLLNHVVIINEKRFTCVSISPYELMIIVDESVDFGHSVTIYDQTLPLYEQTHKQNYTALQQLTSLQHDTLLVNYII